MSSNKLVAVAVVSVILAVFLLTERQICAQACYIPGLPKDPVVMYEDGFGVGWSNTGSWGVGTPNPPSLPDDKWGTQFFAVQFFQNWSGVEFMHDTPFTVGWREYLSFRVRKEDSFGMLYVSGHRGDGSVGGWVPVGDYLFPAQSGFTEKQWYSVRIPLYDMGISVSTQLRGIIFQSSTPTVAYFDDVVLIPGLSLAFPLDGYTPETIGINTVFDHTNPRGRLGDNDGDNRVVAWTGERGDGTILTTPNVTYQYTCRAKSSADTFGPNFVLNGNYTGSGCRGLTSYLSYNSHAGIDFRAPTDTPVYAVDTGFIIGSSTPNGSLDCPSDGSPCIMGTSPTNLGTYGRMRIQHSNGYTTSYTHLDRQVGGLTLGAVINKGQQIGWSGKTSRWNEPVDPHLHFAISVSPDLYSTPIDPYGWTGWYEDPYKSSQRPVFNSRQWQ